MQEVLSKHAEFNVPLKEMEYYELSLLEEWNQLGTRHYVQQFHGQWSEVDGQLMWDEEEKEYFWILAEAKRRYAERRRAMRASAKLGHSAPRERCAAAG
jgi:hypothetical protein